MFEKFKTKAQGLGQKFLVKVGQAEAFKEDDDFIKKIDNFKATREGMRLLAEKGRYMINTETTAASAKIAYLEEFGKFGDMEGADPRIKKFTDALKSYVEHTKEATKKIDEFCVLVEKDFHDHEIEDTRTLKNDLNDTRTLRDAANRNRIKDSEQFKTEKDAEEWKRLDEKYKADREVLLERVAAVEERKNNYLLKHLSVIFSEMYHVHATCYSEMAVLDSEITQTLAQVTEWEERNPVKKPEPPAQEGASSSSSSSQAPSNAPPAVPTTTSSSAPPSSQPPSVPASAQPKPPANLPPPVPPPK